MGDAAKLGKYVETVVKATLGEVFSGLPRSSAEAAARCAPCSRAGLRGACLLSEPDVHFRADYKDCQVRRAHHQTGSIRTPRPPKAWSGYTATLEYTPQGPVLR